MHCFSLRVPDGLSKHIKALALIQKTTFAQLTVSALEAYINQFDTELKQKEAAISEQFKGWEHDTSED